MSRVVISQSLPKGMYGSGDESNVRRQRVLKRRTNLRLQRGLIDRSYHGLEITEVVKNLDLQYLANSVCLDECEDEKMKVVLNVEKCPGGSFLKGTISVKLQLRCERCGAPFFHPIQSHFEIWANSKIRSLSETMDINELPFPPSANYLDITEVVEMATEEGFPRLLVCGTSECAVSTHSSTQDMIIGIESETHENQFSMLRDLRNALKQQEIDF